MTTTTDGPLILRTSWGDRHIHYLLVREPRRDLTITVYPDLRVAVRAPSARPLDQVLERVHAKRAWIARQLVRFEQLPDENGPRFQSGESHLYLGRQYRLSVERTGSGVSLQAGRLIARVRPTAGPRAVRNAVRRWYSDRAHVVFTERAAMVQRETRALRGRDFQLRIRLMVRRWGSCTSRSVITLNPLLLQAPLPCVDYVIAHELVHVLEHGHSARFYRLMGQVMPDWQKRRDRLAQLPIRPL